MVRFLLSVTAFLYIAWNGLYGCQWYCSHCKTLIWLKNEVALRKNRTMWMGLKLWGAVRTGVTFIDLLEILCLLDSLYFLYKDQIWANEFSITFGTITSLFQSKHLCQVQHRLLPHCFHYLWLVESHLTGYFCLFILKFLEGDRDLQMVFC